MVSSKNQIKPLKKKSKKLKASEGISSNPKNEMKRSLKTHDLEEIKNRFIGERGTIKRDAYEDALRLDLIGESIRKTRMKRNLTQEQLGELVGVQKSQISKIENNFKDTRISTILKVFDALEARILIKVEVL
jgi:HTH-type transcriptional regulator/antitoxin HipB